MAFKEALSKAGHQENPTNSVKEKYPKHAHRDALVDLAPERLVAEKHASPRPPVSDVHDGD
jgi:hypothetical protein